MIILFLQTESFYSSLQDISKIIHKIPHQYGSHSSCSNLRESINILRQRQSRNKETGCDNAEKINIFKESTYLFNILVILKSRFKAIHSLLRFSRRWLKSASGKIFMKLISKFEIDEEKHKIITQCFTSSNV